MGTVDGRWVCPICGADQDAEAVGVVADVSRKWRRNQTRTREPICRACATLTFCQSSDQRTSAYPPHVLTPPAPCVVCGRVVELAANVKRKTITCSDKCRLAQYRTPVTDEERSCAGCGQTMTGRADRRFCSPACRQRAHRQRSEPTQAALAMPQPPTRGPRLKHRQVVERMAPQLAGLALVAREVVELDASLTPDAAAKHAADLGRDLRELGRLRRLLQERASAVTGQQQRGA